MNLKVGSSSSSGFVFLFTPLRYCWSGRRWPTNQYSMKFHRKFTIRTRVLSSPSHLHLRIHRRLQRHPWDSLGERDLGFLIGRPFIHPDILVWLKSSTHTISYTSGPGET